MTTDPAPDSFPRWSPDGRHIAFQRGGWGTLTELWLMEADGSNPCQLYAGDDVWGLEMAWHSTLNRIYFTAGVDSGSSGMPQRLMWVEADCRLQAGTPVIASPDTNYLQLDIAPDGVGLASTWYNGHSWAYAQEICHSSLTPDGNSMTAPVCFTNDSVVDSTPRFSPDGASIIWEREVNSDYDLWSVDVQSGAAARLGGACAAVDAFDIMPAYAPDGDYLVFTSDRAGSRQLWVAAADCSQAWPLTTGSATAEYADWWRSSPSPPTDCPGSPNTVCVVDAAGQPVSDTLIYRNGTLVSEPDGLPAVTDSRGSLDLPDLNPGETLAALQPVYDQPTDRAGHPDDLAFQVYRTSMPVSNNGDVEAYIISSGTPSNTLSLRPTQTLVLFNLLVSVEWDAGSDYLDELKIGLEKASDLLYDATDGQMAFGRIDIYDNAEQWYEADIQIRTHNHTWPHAYVGGINSSGVGRLVYKTVDPDPGPLVLGRYWSGTGADQGPWSAPIGYTTIAHEFGHYGLFLFDEYFYYTEESDYRVRESSRCSFYADQPASLMYYQYDKTEFCNRPEQYPEHHGGPPTRQTQIYGPHETSWVTIQGVYSDVLQTMSADAPAWQIISPPDRDAAFVPGPAQPLLDFPQIIDHSTNQGAFTRKPLTVKYEGRPVWGSLVALHQSSGAVLDQGLTDSQGRIDILGAATGDTVRVRTPENSLAGSLTVRNALPETINLTPVNLNSAGSTIYANNTITNSTPLVTIVPRTDGGTIDYFVEKTGELTNAVYANILGAGAPPLAAKTMSYDPGQARYVATFSGYSPGLLNGLTFQMTTTVGSGFVEIGIGHDRSHTDGAGNDLDLTTTDGNLILNAPGGSFSGPTYVVANPTNALPASPPTGLVVIGQPYSVQPSGALTGSQRAMALSLSYQSVSLGEVDESSLQPYYWSAAQNQWQPVLSYTLDTSAKRASASTDLFGIYTLMGEIPGPTISSVNPVSGSTTAATVVVIAGDNFEDGTQVRLGDAITLTTVTFINAQTLMISIPDGVPPGSYDLTVVNPNGQSATLPTVFTITGGRVYLPVIIK